jgi:multiple sugar transport system substrate-binding protein
VISKFLKVALFSSVLFATVLRQEDVVWWDFLGGGDGVRMKQLISNSTLRCLARMKSGFATLEWGVPFYKVQPQPPLVKPPTL